jgi:peptidoglycan/LPS O-acetylase OafA/YrhL
MRNPCLDVLRLIAVLLVLGRHFAHEAVSSSGFLAAWYRGGWIGVDVFFVLSGFLISGLLFDEQRKRGSVDVGRFLIRRGFKIYPAFWVMIIATLAARYALRGHEEGRGIAMSALAEFLFIQNYIPGLWSITWTLAVEEHFYIGLALLTGLLCRGRAGVPNPFQSIPWIFAGLAVGCLWLRIRVAARPGPLDYFDFFGTQLRIDSLMFGVLLRYLHEYGSLRNWVARIPALAWSAAGCTLLAPAFVWDVEPGNWLLVYGVILFYCGAGCLVLATTKCPKTIGRAGGFLAMLGAGSYSMYLWHTAVNWGVTEYWHRSGREDWAAYAAAYVVGAIAFGWVMGHLVELPVLRLRERFFPTRRAALPSNPAS